MSESFVQVPVDSTGKMLRTLSGSIGGNEVHSEVVILGDSTNTIIDPAKDASILADLVKPASGKYVSELNLATGSDGNLSTIIYSGSSTQGTSSEKLFTLSFTYDVDNNLTKIVRS